MRQNEWKKSQKTWFLSCLFWSFLWIDATNLWMNRWLARQSVDWTLNSFELIQIQIKLNFITQRNINIITQLRTLADLRRFQTNMSSTTTNEAHMMFELIWNIASMSHMTCTNDMLFLFSHGLLLLYGGIHKCFRLSVCVMICLFDDFLKRHMTNLHVVYWLDLFKCYSIIWVL